MEYTDRLQLIKPAPTDEYDILQFNENADKITKHLNAALYEKTATGAGVHITDNAGTTIRITNDNASAVNAIIDGIDVSIPAGSTVDYPAADSGVTISRQVIIASNADITAKWFVSANDIIDAPIPAANVSYDNTNSGLTATNTQAAIDELEQNMVPIPIPNNSDLNDYTESGNYYVATSATAGTIANTPYSNTGFALAVIRTGTNLRTQIMYCGSPVMHYIKTRALQYSSGVWNYGEWIDLPVMRTVPSSPTAGGTVGQMAVDSDYLYICIATNTWRRVALSTW